MTWQQDYTPIAHSLAWSSLAGATPMLVLIYLLAWKRKPAWLSALASLGAAAFVALVFYRMPPLLAFASSLYGAAFGLLPIGWITLNSILLYRLTLETGQFEVIKRSLTGLTTDRRLQVLVIAFAFGAFIEGAAGSGVPVAVGAATLAGLGFPPLQAAVICLLANTAPVAFGAIGTPILTLAATTGLSISRLSTCVASICAPLAFFIPIYLTALVGGRKGVRGALPASLLCGFSFASVKWLVAWRIGPQLTDVLASLAALFCLIVLLRVWQPKDNDSHLGAPPAERSRDSAGTVWWAWAPYALLAVCVLLWGLPAMRGLLDHTTPLVAWPALDGQVRRMPPVVPAPTAYAAVYRFEWLSSPGTACLLASALAAAFAGMSPLRFAGVFARTLRTMAFPLITIASVLSLAFLMNYCGATATLGLAFAGTGRLFPFFSPLLGWMGVFLTGSDASSNALFGNLQVVTARRLSLNPILMASANSSGGVMGKMISVQTIAVAAAATGMDTASETQLFRFNFWRSLMLASAIGLLVTAYAYLLPTSTF
jgi:L-lactate transport